MLANAADLFDAFQSSRNGDAVAQPGRSGFEFCPLRFDDRVFGTAIAIADDEGADFISVGFEAPFAHFVAMAVDDPQVGRSRRGLRFGLPSDILPMVFVLAKPVEIALRGDAGIHDHGRFRNG